MKTSVIIFPGSNCDRDAAVTVEAITGAKAQMVWHGEPEVPPSDLIILPGGFSYGDYLRCGAMAAHSPIMRDVVAKAKSGVPVLGICNGFQMLIETGLLPGALMRNASLHFICRDVWLKVVQPNTMFTSRYHQDQVIRIPVAHHDGNYFADCDTLRELEDQARIVLRYCDAQGRTIESTNPNGSQHNIAGIIDASGRVMGLMPHPERMADAALGGTDGALMFESIMDALVC